MGVYIKGMEMPTSCWDCEVGGAKQIDNATCPFYSMEYWEQEEYQDKIADGCPLVPVPPHGRLKEEEWLKKIISRAIEINASIEPRSEAVEQERRCLWWFEQQIGIAPTIIPAEEGE